MNSKKDQGRLLSKSLRNIVALMQNIFFFFNKILVRDYRISFCGVCGAKWFSGWKVGVGLVRFGGSCYSIEYGFHPSCFWESGAAECIIFKGIDRI